MTTARATGIDDKSDLDGRVQRSVRTRAQVLDAFLSLIEEGDLAPTAQRIAERSGTPLRTVFHQFNDIDTIHELAGQRLKEQMKRRSRPVPDYGPLGRRINTFSANRAELMQAIHSTASSARLREPFSVMLRKNRDTLIELGDQEIRKVFARELTPMSPPARDALVASIALVSNWPAWYSLVEELGLDVHVAAEVMLYSVRALLGSRRVLAARN